MARTREEGLGNSDKNDGCCLNDVLSALGIGLSKLCERGKLFREAAVTWRLNMTTATRCSQRHFWPDSIVDAGFSMTSALTIPRDELTSMMVVWPVQNHAWPDFMTEAAVDLLQCQKRHAEQTSSAADIAATNLRGNYWAASCQSSLTIVHYIWSLRGCVRGEDQKEMKSRDL